MGIKFCDTSIIYEDVNTTKFLQRLPNNVFAGVVVSNISLAN